MTAFYSPPVEELAKYYDELFATLTSKYGRPQQDRSPLPSECQAGLAACLEHGVSVKGAKWYWKKGSVSLAPDWYDNRAELDVRYAPEDAEE